MDFKLNSWIKMKRFNLFWSSDQFKKKANVSKASILAVVFGVVLGILIICGNGYNGFAFFFSIFQNAFDSSVTNGSETILDQTIMYFSAYFLIGLGISLGFKLGIFNMGGSGQAVLGMAFATHLLFTTDQSFNASYAIVVIIVFALSGVLISTIAGVLKAYLNVHEVVTTIMMNWIVWYFFKWFDRNIITYTGTPGTPDMKGDGGFSSWFQIGGNPIAFGLILVVAAIGITWVVTTFTTAGYKLKVVGKQKEAAKYAGINARLYIICTMAIQGILIGLGSLIFYFQIRGKLEVLPDTVPTIGFDALTIPLVAFNNIFGMIPVALLWAVIKSGMDGAIFSFQGLQRETGSLMFGLIIYGAAVYVLFLKIDPWKWIKTWMAVAWDWTAKVKIRTIKNNLKVMRIRRKFLMSNPELVQQKNEVEKLKTEWQRLKVDQKSTGQKGPDGLAEIAYHKYVKAKKMYHFEVKTMKQSTRSAMRQMRRDIRVVHSESLKTFTANTLGAVRSSFISTNKNSLFSSLDEITRKKVERHELITVEKSKFADQNVKLKANIAYVQQEEQINDRYQNEFAEIIEKYNEFVNIQKVKFQTNLAEAKRMQKQINEQIKNTKKQNLAEYNELIKNEKLTQKTARNKYQTIVKEIKKGETDFAQCHQKLWDVQNNWIIELNKSFTDVSKTKLYVGMIKHRAEGMEVVRKYGCY